MCDLKRSAKLLKEIKMEGKNGILHFAVFEQFLSPTYPVKLKIQLLIKDRLVGNRGENEKETIKLKLVSSVFSAEMKMLFI